MALAAVDSLPEFPPTSYDASDDVTALDTAEGETSSTQAAPMTRLLTYYAAFFSSEVDPVLNPAGTPSPANLQS